jgi:UDP-glucose 4-epimerase
MKILVTGATGYIGSHTVLDLLENGFNVVGIDNFKKSSKATIDYISKRLGANLYCADLCNRQDIESIIRSHTDIDAVIHFAAYKSVEESVNRPLDYYSNNIDSLLNLLAVCGDRKFIFSSSCTVYGEPDSMPVNEDTRIKPATSPYGATKQMCERILQDWSKATGNQVVLLRYFNPAGAHPSLEIGEEITEQSRNLIPLIVGAAAGIRGPINIFGSDYPTRDGTCIRDFIHVCDLAAAHRIAITTELSEHISIFNLGSESGVTVKEAISAFEATNNITVPHVFTNRRPGDISAIYADCTRAYSVLGWKTCFTLNDIMQSAWQYYVSALGPTTPSSLPTFLLAPTAPTPSNTNS